MTKRRAIQCHANWLRTSMHGTRVLSCTSTRPCCTRVPRYQGDISCTGLATSAWAWPYCAFATKWRVVWKSISTPPFEDENIFQKSATLVVSGIVIELQPTWPIFEKCSHLREKWGGADFFPGLYGGLYGQNLPYKFKKFVWWFPVSQLRKIT